MRTEIAHLSGSTRVYIRAIDCPDPDGAALGNVQVYSIEGDRVTLLDSVSGSDAPAGYHWMGSFWQYRGNLVVNWYGDGEGWSEREYDLVGDELVLVSQWDRSWTDPPVITEFP